MFFYNHTGQSTDNRVLRLQFQWQTQSDRVTLDLSLSHDLLEKLLADMVTCLLCVNRKVQKSLADLEKLHLAGQGINLSLPTGAGQNKVLNY